MPTSGYTAAVAGGTTPTLGIEQRPVTRLASTTPQPLLTGVLVSAIEQSSSSPCRRCAMPDTPSGRRALRQAAPNEFWGARFPAVEALAAVPRNDADAEDTDGTVSAEDVVVPAQLMRRVPAPVPIPMPVGAPVTRYAPPPLDQPMSGAGTYVGWTVAAFAPGRSASTRNAVRPAPLANEAGTAAIWWYVFSPIIIAGALLGVAAANIGVAGSSFTELTSSTGSQWFFRGAAQFITTGALGFLLTLALLFRDRATLVDRGFHSMPSPWWQLMTPLGYLIYRTAQVKKQSGGGVAPLAVYLSIYFAPALVLGLIAGLEVLRA